MIEREFRRQSAKSTFNVLMHVLRPTARDLPAFIEQLRQWGFGFPLHDGRRGPSLVRTREEMMRNLFIYGIAACFLLVGCGLPTLDQAGRSYRANRDYASLETIYGQLTEGMARADVEGFLGEPDYSPIDGQFYYSSDRRGAADGRDNVPVGVVVDYREESGAVTDTLQDFWIGPIGE